MSATQQARADAVADAATLMAVAREILAYGAGVYAARKDAMRVVMLGAFPGSFLFKTRPDRNYNRVVCRARAAFQAVPALRGDR